MARTPSKSTQAHSTVTRTRRRSTETVPRTKAQLPTTEAEPDRAAQAPLQPPAAQDPLAALAERVAALEAAAAASRETSAARGTAQLTANDDRYWALNELNRQRIEQPSERGAVLYAGTVALPSGAQYVWQRQDSTRTLIEQNWHDLADNIAALGHPVRLSILKHALGQDRSTQDFMALHDMGTTGQLFHHIKTLQDAGWLRSLQRGLYGVPGERVVPLLAILAAARG
jgi:hypothetical protein